VISVQGKPGETRGRRATGLKDAVQSQPGRQRTSTSGGFLIKKHNEAYGNVQSQGGLHCIAVHPAAGLSRHGFPRGFRVYRGTSSDSYDTTVTMGNVNTYTTGDLPPGTYYFAVTAFDNTGNESGPSNEAMKIIASPVEQLPDITVTDSVSALRGRNPRGHPRTRP
jgi:hypothetical protein